MTDGDDKVREHYRALGRDEPPQALDAAILAASRKAVAPRRLSQRWALPVSLAAVLVLALGVTMRMQQEQPGIEVAAPASEYSLPPSAAPSEPAAKERDQAASAPEAKLVPQDKVTGQAKLASKPKTAAEPAAPPPPAQEPARRMDQVAPTLEKKALTQDRAAASEPKPFAERQEEAGAAPAPAAPAALRAKREERSAALADAKVSPDPRVRELERIAQLRRDGKQAEADEALAKFRREHPDYRIPDPLWEQVKPR